MYIYFFKENCLIKPITFKTRYFTIAIFESSSLVVPVNVTTPVTSSAGRGLITSKVGAVLSMIICFISSLYFFCNSRIRF